MSKDSIAIGPAMPSKAEAGMANVHTPADQKTPKGKTKPSEAAIIGSKGEYLPAEYLTRRGNTRQDR